MANSWLRLWHDMPNDPKWRTISRVSGQSISVVQSMYLHLLVSASQNVTRGHADVTLEDLASALDVTDEAVKSVFDAMQGRVLEGMYISGWEKRQPKREDAASAESRAKSAAQRKREQREREKNQDKPQDVTKSHEVSHEVTTDKDKDTDTDTDTELNTPLESPQGEVDANRSESKSPEKRKLQKRKTRIPADFTLTQSRAHAAMNYWQEQNRPDIDVRQQWDKFTTHHQAKGTTMLDWNAAWKTWYVNAIEFCRGSPPPRPGLVSVLPSDKSSKKERVRASLQNLHDTSWA